MTDHDQGSWFDPPVDPTAQSAEIAARRDAMRAGLSRAVVTRRRLRRVRSAALLIGLGLFIAWPALRGTGDDLHVPQPTNPELVAQSSDTDGPQSRDGLATAEFDQFDFAVIRTDPARFASYAIRSTTAAGAWLIDDEELVQALRSAGHETGVMRVDGKLLLSGDPLADAAE